MKMNLEQFAFWMRGSVESRNFDTITLEDARTLLKSIQDHSALPFIKVAPELPKPKEPVKAKEVDINELLKKAREDAIKNLNPSGIKITPFQNPARPYDFDKPNYWLDNGMKPGVLYC